MSPVPTTVIRHQKERIAKCSLRFLHDRPEMTFLRARPGFTFDGTGFLLLAVDAPPLGPADAGRPLLLLDSTWRWLPQLRACVTGDVVLRSIPGAVATAYPRISKVFDDPAAGLASIEALYLARALLGDVDPTLLDHYHWKDAFLANVAAAGL
jgi:pre-rRNA-processing protein TSR3